jgi:hypothetical protein
MDEEKKKIKEELINFDPKLQKYGDELEKIIANLIDVKPNPEINKEFVARLERQISEQIESRKEKKLSLKNIFTFSKFSYVLGGALIVVIFVMPLTWFFVSNYYNSEDFENRLVLNNVKKDNNAFGSLSMNVQDLYEIPAGDSYLQGISKFDNTISGYAFNEYDLNNHGENIGHKYTYKGNIFEIPYEKMKVYKSKNVFDHNEFLSKTNNYLGLGIMDFSRFTQLAINNLNILSFDNSGYSIEIDYNKQTINIYKKGYENFYLDSDQQINHAFVKLSDNQTYLNIAKSFINKYNLNLDNYALAEVVKPGIAGQKVHKSQSVTVFYPLLIDDKFVYNLAGDKVGASFEINVKIKKIIKIINLFASCYEYSLYDIKNDFREITEIAESGGILQTNHFLEFEKIEDISLKDPVLAYIYIDHYQNQYLTKENVIFVPAMIFFVKDKDIKKIGKDKIIVPLIQDNNYN